MSSDERSFVSDLRTDSLDPADVKELHKFVEGLIHSLINLENQINTFKANKEQRGVSKKVETRLDELSQDKGLFFKRYGLEESIARTGNAAKKSIVEKNHNASASLSTFVDGSMEETPEMGILPEKLLLQYKHMYETWFSILVSKMEVVIEIFITHGFVSLTGTTEDRKALYESNFSVLKQVTVLKNFHRIGVSVQKKSKIHHKKRNK